MARFVGRRKKLEDSVAISVLKRGANRWTSEKRCRVSVCDEL